jgi:branched-chain amino acid transport system ATP-binding protein
MHREHPADRLGLAVEGLSVRDGRRTALTDVYLSAPRGQVLGIVSMDSTCGGALLESIAGMRVRSGRVTLDGDAVPVGRPDLAARLGIVLAPTAGSTIPGLTVSEHLAIAGTVCRGEGGVGLGASIDQLCASRSGQLAATLSGGERRLLALAMVARCSRRVVLLDEPSEGIAIELKSEVRAAIRALAKDAAVLVADSDRRLLEAVADRVIILEAGRIVAAGGPELLASRHGDLGDRS